MGRPEGNSQRNGAGNRTNNPKGGARDNSTRHNPRAKPIPGSLVFWLGVSQLVCWGTSYYLIGGFGGDIGAAMGWSRNTVYGGFALGLLLMGLTSPLTGRLIDAHGGGKVMMTGSLLNALGCAMLAACHTLPVYYLAWVVLGLGMRLTLYDAAFAALARLGGPEARGPISQITLLGGLASTAFWPLGHYLAEQFGWRAALLVYAGLALATLPLHWMIPGRRYEGPKVPAAAGASSPASSARSSATSLAESRTAASPSASSGASAEASAGASAAAISAPPPAHLRGADMLLAGGLYAAVMTLANFLNAGMSAHMIGLLDGMGLGAAISVWIATLRGVGQSGARLCEILFGRRVEPLMLNLMACVFMPLAFVSGLFSDRADAAAIAFALVYGACNGLLTITRGTVPLVLFDPRTYGALVGRLLVPTFVLSAASPLIYSAIMDGLGMQWALYLSIACTALMLLGALVLKLRYGRAQAPVGDGLPSRAR